MTWECLLNLSVREKSSRTWHLSIGRVSSLRSLRKNDEEVRNFMVKEAEVLSTAQTTLHSLPRPASHPENLALKCPKCNEMLLGRDWEKNLKVCSRCSYHFKLSSRSEEHTSELQSRFDLVCRLLLEKKKIKNKLITQSKTN